MFDAALWCDGRSGALAPGAETGPRVGGVCARIIMRTAVYIYIYIILYILYIYKYRRDGSAGGGGDVLGLRPLYIILYIQQYIIIYILYI